MKRILFILLSMLIICALFLPACKQIEDIVPGDIKKIVTPGEKPTKQEPALEVDAKIISVEIGKTGVIRVAASKDDGSQDTVTAEPSNDQCQQTG